MKLKHLETILGCMLFGHKAGFTTIILDSVTKEYTFYRFSRGKLAYCKDYQVVNEYHLIQAHLIQTGF